MDQETGSDQDALGIADAREAGPANVGAIGKVVNQVLGLAQLLEHRRALDARLEGGRGNWRRHGEEKMVGEKEKSGEVRKVSSTPLAARPFDAATTESKRERQRERRLRDKKTRKKVRQRTKHQWRSSPSVRHPIIRLGPKICRHTSWSLQDWGWMSPGPAGIFPPQAPGPHSEPLPRQSTASISPCHPTATR